MNGIEPKLKIGSMYPITPSSPTLDSFSVSSVSFSCDIFWWRMPVPMNYFDRQDDNLKTILPNQLQSTFELGARILVQPKKRKFTNLILNLV